MRKMGRDERDEDTTALAISTGLMVGAFALASPVLILGIPAVMGANYVRKTIKKHSNKQEEERREADMKDDYPVRFPVAKRDLIDPFCLYPSSHFSENPLTTLSRMDPELAHDIFKKESQDNLTLGLANSSVATKFADKGKGTYVATRRKRGWFSGGEITETVIKPIP
jgi:hypothetical protein